jgi:hypothetical protein
MEGVSLVHRETGPKARLLKDYRRVYDAQPTFSNIFFMPRVSSTIFL